MRHRFAATTFLLAGGLLVWVADFAFVYIFAAVACARGFASVDILGLPLVPVVTTVASLSAGAVTAWLLRRGYRIHHDTAIDEHDSFIGFVALATCIIALVALVMLILPPLLIRACTH
ncbi:MAG: hypothetical protein ABW171_06940 [Steroidobacter sp.]